MGKKTSLTASTHPMSVTRYTMYGTEMQLITQRCQARNLISFRFVAGND